MAVFVPSDQKMRELLEESRRIAVVGLSDKPDRDSYRVARYLQENGYEIIPVNPNIDQVLGVKAAASLEEIDGTVDIVDVFRKSEDVLPIAEAAVKIGAACLWLQLGVINDEAAKLAQDAGLEVVMDRCIKVEHARLV